LKKIKPKYSQLAEVQTAEVQTSEVQTAEVRTAEVQTAEVQSTEVHPVEENKAEVDLRSYPPLAPADMNVRSGCLRVQDRSAVFSA